MKKYILSAIVVIIIVAVIIFDRTRPATQPVVISEQPTPTTTIDSSSPVPTGSTTPPSTTPTTPTTTPSSTPVPKIGMYKDGEYTGSVANVIYGNTQVKAIISGGKVTDVQFVQYPNDRPETKEVSAMAMPKLTAEAIAAQSANVDVVSGATQTSQAFMQSLSSALAQAKS